MEQKKRRGRPCTYTHDYREELAGLIREHGARRTAALLDGAVSMSTLVKIAKEFQIQLKPGRRPSRAA